MADWVELRGGAQYDLHLTDDVMLSLLPGIVDSRWLVELHMNAIKTETWRFEADSVDAAKRMALDEFCKWASPFKEMIDKAAYEAIKLI